MKTLKTITLTAALVAVACSALFCINTNAQTNAIFQENFYFNTNQISWGWTNSEGVSLSSATGRYVLKPGQIQLSAKISSELVTNWTTTRIESPVCDEPKPGLNIITLLYRATGYHESGGIISNTVATIEWRGKQVPVVLESVQVGTTKRVTWK